MGKGKYTCSYLDITDMRPSFHCPSTRCIACGLMLTDDHPKLLNQNCIELRLSSWLQYQESAWASLPAEVQCPAQAEKEDVS